MFEVCLLEDDSSGVLPIKTPRVIATAETLCHASADAKALSTPNAIAIVRTIDGRWLKAYANGFLSGDSRRLYLPTTF